MSRWDAGAYLRFADERTRPAVELAARVPLRAPATVVDLGCGPGNSTAVLRGRWPGARVLGLDASSEMIEAALAAHPEGEWLLADVRTFAPPAPVDLLFANAVLHWLPDHRALVPRLLERVAEGGALAFQVPSGAGAPFRRHALEVADDPAWSERLAGAREALTMESPEVYYDLLADRVGCVDIWETEYCHVMADADAIVGWYAATGLRPFLGALSDDVERLRFLERLGKRVAGSYPPRADGQVLFPFRRLFVVACR